MQKYFLKKKLDRLEVSTMPKTPFFFYGKKSPNGAFCVYFTYNHAIFGRLNLGRRVEGDLEKIFDRRYVEEKIEILLSVFQYSLYPYPRQIKTKDSY